MALEISCGVAPMTSVCADRGPHLPIEMVFQCLVCLPGPRAHYVISTLSCTFQGVAKDDSLWLGRLQRDFPRVRLLGKAPGTLYITYKILFRAHRRHFRAMSTTQEGEQERSESWWQLMASRPERIAELAEEASSLARVSHNIDAHTAICDGCHQSPILGERFKCASCADYDLCGQCHARRHEVHPRHDQWTIMEARRPISSTLNLTQDEVEQHVRQLRSWRREEPRQVASLLEAHGGVARSVAILEGSHFVADSPASAFQSVGASPHRPRNAEAVAEASSSDGGNEAYERDAEIGTPPCEQARQRESLHVIQHIAHVDQPAQINEREAAEFVALQHACFIERNLGCGETCDRESPIEQVAGCGPPGTRERVVLGKLNRLPKALREELSTGAALRSCRNALEAAGHPFKLFSGTFVFVHPAQYRSVVSALSCYDLRPYNVVFAESFEHLLEETMAHHRGAWLSTSTPLVEITNSATELCAASDGESVDDRQSHVPDEMGCGEDGEQAWVMCIQRTFVTLVPFCALLEKHMTASAPPRCSSALINPRAAALRLELWVN